MDKTWTSGDAKLLRELRQAAGIDRATLARRCALSIGQLSELEDGGNKQFYSDRIKSHTGRAVLARLGHTLAPAPASTPATASAPAAAAAHVAAPTPISNPAAAPGAALAPALGTNPKHSGQSGRMDAPAVSEQGAEPRAAPHLSAAFTPPTAPPTAPSSSPTVPLDTPSPAGPPPAQAATTGGRFWVGVLVVGVVVVGFLAWLNRPQSPAPVALPAAAPEALAETSQVPSTPSSAPAATDVSVAAAAETPPAAALAAKGEQKCPSAPGEPAVFIPDRALRDAGYIYIEALQATVVCVTDARQKRSELVLTAGQRINSSGTPPFTLQAARWADIRLFYQGVRVPIEDPALSAGALVLQAR